MKKILSFILACAMIFTMVLPMSVFAEGEVTISKSSPVTIEIDEYATARVANFADAVNGKAVATSWSQSAFDVEIPVVISESGVYNIKYIASNYKDMGADAAAYSKVNFILTDAEGTSTTIASTSSGAIIDELEGKYATFAMDVDLFMDTSYIEAGSYTLKAEVTQAGGLYRGLMDTIMFEAAAGEETIGDSVVTIRWADYKTGTSALREDGDLKYLTEDWSSDPAQETMALLPVTVAKSGFYDIEYVSSSTGGSYGAAFVELDNETIIDKTATVLEDVSSTYATYWSGKNAVKKYGRSRVWLDEGIYALKAKAEKEGGFYRALADYIKFTPSAPNPATDPVISSATFKVGDDGVVTPSYVFTSPLGNADASTFTLKYDGAVVGSFAYGEGIIVPESVRTAPGYDKTKVSLEAMAKDAEGNSGVAVIKFVYIDMTASYAAGAVTPELTIVKGSSAFNAVLLVAFYDTNEAGDKYLLKIEQKHIEVTTDTPYELSDWSASTTVTDLDYEGVTPETAEVYLLGCTASTAEEKANPIFHTTLEELVCVENITIG